MLHPKAIIRRPAIKTFDTSNVIKADQFPTWHSQFFDKTVGFTDVLKMALNVRALDTIREWGEMLKRQHRPANQLELPDFMQPRVPASDSARGAEQAPPSVATIVTVPPRQAAEAQAPAAGGEPLARKLICVQCKSRITFAEGKFCWNNERRFGGLQYCREHQALF